jgi:hypothetical protein
MRNKWFYYIKINEQDNSIITSGITFKEFIKGISEKPRNLLRIIKALLITKY